MPFKMITLSEKNVGRIAGNAGAFANKMARALAEKYRGQLLEGQKELTVEQLQLGVRDQLRGLRGEMAVIERQHFERLGADKLSRQTRDVTLPQLRLQLVGIHALFDSNYGFGVNIKVFGEPDLTIPYDPFPLRRVGFTARDNLLNPRLVLPPAQLSGVRIDTRQLVKGFEPHLFELDRVLVELEDTLPLTNETLERKLRMLKTLRAEAGIAARFLESLYVLAGHEEIASRVRVTNHRPREPQAVTPGGPASPGTDDDTAPEPGVGGPPPDPAPDDAPSAGASAATAPEEVANEEEQAVAIAA